jgi:hypothetical protein
MRFVRLVPTLSFKAGNPVAPVRNVRAVITPAAGTT